MTDKPFSPTGISLSDVIGCLKMLVDMEKKGHKLDDDSVEIMKMVSTIISNRYSPHMFDDAEQKMIIEIVGADNLTE
jgi:hypothetical protein|tara:strand:+ start:637 stop:867 length:231 start_codon:yes stop_codon:yes gene_type:complete